MKIRNNQTIKSILIIRLSSLGDIILTSLTVRNLRNRFPNARIDFLTYKEFSQTLDSNPYLNNVYTLNRNISLKNIINFAKELIIKNNGKYDVAIDLQGKLKSILIKHLSACHSFDFPKYSLKKKLLVCTKINKLPTRSIAERFLDVTRHLGVQDDGSGFQIHLPEERNNPTYPPFARTYPKKNKFIIGVAPGAKHLTKRYPAAHYAKMCNLIALFLDAEFCFIGSKGDDALLKEIETESGIKFINRGGSESLYDTIRLLDKCDVLVSNDSAPAHIAAARRTPVVMIYGSTVPAFGFPPFRTPSSIIEVDLECRPCTHIGRAACPKRHLKCLLQIEPEAVARSVIDLISATFVD
jgi:lipopolysaccharide heptosyltransferase II